MTVAVGGTGVLVGGTGVLVGGTGVLVAVAGICVGEAVGDGAMSFPGSVVAWAVGCCACGVVAAAICVSNCEICVIIALVVAVAANQADTNDGE